MSDIAKQVVDRIQSAFILEGHSMPPDAILMPFVMEGLTAARESDAKELAELRNKLHFLASKGISVGTLKESGKPPRLSYVIESGSELCDMPTLDKLLDAELQLAKLTASDWVERAAEEIRHKLNEGLKEPLVMPVAESVFAEIITRHRDAAK